MSPDELIIDRWRRTEEVFHRVLDAPAAERAARLKELCAGDAELLQEAESLLKSWEAQEHLSAEYIATQRADSRVTRAGRRIGPYQLERILGRGGMGAVYLAHRARCRIIVRRSTACVLFRKLPGARFRTNG